MLWKIVEPGFYFVMVLLDVPSFVWHGWLEILNKDGRCGGESGIFYGVFGQLGLGCLFYLTLRLMRAIFVLPLAFAETQYEKRSGFSKSTCLQFVCSRLKQLFFQLGTELPYLVLMDLVLIAVQ